MHSGFNSTLTPLIVPQSVATNATAGSAVFCDSAGHGQVVVEVVLGTPTNTTAPSTFVIQHSDTTDATNFGNITGFVAGTDYTVSQVSTAATSNTQVYAQFNLRCDGRIKRYIRVLFTAGAAAQIMSATARASRSVEAPITAAGVPAVIFVNPS